MRSRCCARGCARAATGSTATTTATYEHSEAVSILDRWWAKWIRSEFMPAMGAQLYRRAQSLEPLDDDPNLDGEHHGSAYQMGWYGYAQKDLRRLLGRRVRGPLSRVYCGGSKTARARGGSASRGCGPR